MLTEAGTIEPGDLRAVTTLLEQLLAGGDDGERWCNLTLEIDEHATSGTSDSVLFSFLAARGPSSPLATVMRADAHLIEIGLQHRAGVKAADQLADAGLERPEDWTVRQDHPRRGLVLAVPAGTPPPEIAAWIVRAMDELNRAPTTGRLRYERYETS